MRSAAWTIIVLLGVLGSFATAQPRRGGPDGSAPPAAGATERREQIKKKIRAMRAYTLTEELALDEQTAGRLFPVLARYDDETDRLLEKRIEVQRRLRRVDASREPRSDPTADPRSIERLIDEAIAVQHSFRDLEDRRIAELRKILTPAQAAKLLVALPELERKIQNQLRRAIVQHRPGAGRRPGAAGADDDDDREPDEPPPPARPPRFRREAPLAPRSTPSNAPGNTPTCDPNRTPCR
jgi:hypothetical protein